MQTRPPESMAGYWINLTSRMIVRLLDGRLRPYGFATGHLPVLRALAVDGPLSQTELAHIARVEQPTMAELLARMERSGLVRRAASPTDQRRSLSSLTRRARTRFPRAVGSLHQAEREALKGFSKRDKAKLIALLQRVVKNVEAMR